ncbi:ABC transporter permease [Paenibacillus athensensis]|uniref:ABC transporter permease n=1 Tax=Paenibacillus athensensis TaxID=1967502 RepID=A0A4Y8Q5A4_9BACL|nr:ABC transporter permease [Paenibacillus athensensis]MCD1259576.1 ABC transporter permease [Paenibacillus athensensis]
MSRLLNLLRNETMKVYIRPRTWILTGLLMLITGIAAVVLHTAPEEQAGGQGWKAAVRQSIEASKQDLEDPGVPDSRKKQLRSDIAIGEYSLAHNVPPMETTLWGGVQSSAALIPLVTLFTVIIAGDMVAGEFTWGTIKLLLIRPASRSKILLAKYMATLLFAAALLLVLLLTTLIVNGFLYGFAQTGMPYLKTTAEGAVRESPMLLYILQTYGLKLIELVMVVTLAFMISTVFRSASLAIGLSIFIMFAGQILSFLLLRYSWGKYFLFANTDLTVYLEGRPPADGMTAGFSVMVLLLYFLVFNVLSWEIFRRRDVAA